MMAAIGRRAVIARGRKQELAALTPIRTRPAGIDHMLEHGIVEQSERIGPFVRSTVNK